MYTCFKLLCATTEMRKVLKENESWKFLNRIILVAGAVSGILRSSGTYTDMANLTTVSME